MKTTFTDRMIEAIQRKKSILNVGLDPQLTFMPSDLVRWACDNYGYGCEAVARLFLRFNKEIIDATSDFAVSVKPNIAFYEGYGHYGIMAYEQTIRHARKAGLLVIADTKRGDGGATARVYASAHIGRVDMFRRDGRGITSVKPPLLVDATTIHGWIAESCVQPFIDSVMKHGTGVFVVVKTSFKPNSEVEQVEVYGRPMWQKLAQFVSQWAQGTEGKSGYQNLGVVIGATYPSDAEKMREILPKAWFLIPGYGAQGGGSDGAVVGINEDGFGGIVNSSRGIIAAFQKNQFRTEDKNFAEAAAKAAEFARDDLNKALKRAQKCPY